MANLTESPIYEPGIFQLEKTTPPLGGAPAFNGSNPSAGHANVQGLQLANRTAWLKQQLESGGSATTLATDLANNTDPLKGANKVGWDGGTVADVLSYSKAVSNYTALRAYVGPASVVRILARNIEGWFYCDPADTTSVDNGGTVIVGTDSRRWKRYYSSEVNIRWFGAVGDGVTDDTAAIQAAINSLSATGGCVLIPEGTFRKSDLVTSIKMVNRVHLKGLGDSSVILHDDRPENTVRQDVLDLSLTIGCKLSDFRILGTLRTYTTEDGQKNAIVGTNVRELRIENITCEALRFMAINLHYVRNGYVTGCTIKEVLRDGLRMTHSQDLRIIGNHFVRIADDAIALHTHDASTVPTAQSIVVADNTFEFCQGIKALGAKSLHIHDNVFRRSIRMPIVVSSTFELEGNTPIFNIQIKNNTIEDTFKSFNTTTEQHAISVDIRNRTNGTLLTRPGVNSSVFPYNYVNDNDVAGAINVGAQGIQICGNTISRTVNAADQLMTALGYGNVLDRQTSFGPAAYSDPTITSDFFDVPVGIWVFGAQRGLTIEGNVFNGGGVNTAAIVLDGNDTNGVHLDQRVIGNTVTDWPGIGLKLNRTSHQSKYVIIRDNTFDLDPLFRHPDHVAPGAASGTPNTWTSIANCIAISVGGTGILGFADGNSFSHCASVCDVVTRLSWGKSNQIFWQPVSGTGLDDNAANLGVRVIPSAIKFIHTIYNGDPTVAAFTNITTTPRTAANVMPTTGTYVYGTLVENTSLLVLGSASSQYILLGWIRMNTGSGHVLNTDWRELRCLTGT